MRVPYAALMTDPSTHVRAAVERVVDAVRAPLANDFDRVTELTDPKGASRPPDSLNRWPFATDSARPADAEPVV